MGNLEEIALKTINELNDEVFDIGSDYYSPFELQSIGSHTVIIFMGVTLWTSEEDEREYIGKSDEKEDLRTFLVRESKLITKDIKKKMKQIK